MRYFAPDAGIEHALEVEIRAHSASLRGNLSLPDQPLGVVLFAHGSGSGRHSPRNRLVARRMNELGLGTLLFDLLTREEEAVDMSTRHLRFDIGLLAGRLVEASHWIMDAAATRDLPIGYFGASTGAAAALVAAAELDDKVGAVVSRGGRPDLAADALRAVRSPTLLVVGGLDDVVIELNRQAFAQLACEKELRIVPGATHLFEEPGTLHEVARLAGEWFARHLSAGDRAQPDAARGESGNHVVR
jgi:dienelactone hydrolase